jgi:hypothetical protein
MGKLLTRLLRLRLNNSVADARVNYSANNSVYVPQRPEMFPSPRWENG